jgi:crotonobetainyl-CoA:carnitine CoA-transferase CaiB-like acyl-CoA transferase
VPAALNGVTVVDFGQYIAGPLTGMLLADQGAEVVHIDPPGGPRFDTPANTVWGRGKHSIQLDLQSAGGRRTAQTLIREADVVIENFRPGVMDRLDLGPDKSGAVNRGLVYCSLPGFGSRDPRASVPGWEIVVQAAAGVLPNAVGDPAVSAVPVSSVYAAFYGSVSVAMALIARQRDGLGQWIEVPLFDATLAAHGFRVQRIHAQPPLPEAPDDPMSGIHGWMGAYRCRDNRYVFFHPGNKHARRFVELLGAGRWDDDPQREARIRELFLGRTSAEWEALGEAMGTEVATFLTTAEWLHSPHARAAGLVVEIADPTRGPVLQPGVQVHLSRTPGSAGRASPRWESAVTAKAVRACTTAAAGRAAESAAAIGRTHPDGANRSPLAALDRIKVVELSILLAGPTCGRTLAEFGAEVVKIESPVGRDTPAAWIPSYRAFHVDVNRGKRSAIVNLKNPGGLELFWRLVADADVLVQNYRPGVLDQLGIGYEAVRARNPRVIYASINTYGPHGPWRARPGHEHLGQASSGMAERFGGDGVPAFQNVRAICDHGTGLMAAYAIGLALFERERSGQGQHVTAALAATGLVLQAPFAYDFPGRTWDEPRGPAALGSSVLQRLYRAQDGWFAVGCGAGQRDDLLRAAGLGSQQAVAAVQGTLEEAFAREPAAAWCQRLAAAGLGAHPMLSVTEVVKDESLRRYGLIVTRGHQELGEVDQLAPIARLSRTPTRIGAPSTPLGSDVRDIAAQYGLSEELPRLVEQGAVLLV